MRKSKPTKRFPDKKYNIIYADPPWRFRLWDNKASRSCADNHYPTMELSNIKNLPVMGLADDDCVLFLWATAPCLPDAIDTARCWGFTYKTVAFVWVKTNKNTPGLFTGMGYWSRSNTEYCLLCTRGHPHRVSTNVHQVCVYPRREHSRKPDIVRDRIVQLCGDLPRIELFARQRTVGWDVWGNEV